MRILIVDDDKDMLVIIEHVLRSYGECDTALDGEDALEKFRTAWDEDKPYSLICLDIMMPKLNGIETLEAIRKIEAEEMEVGGIEGVRIVMLTALEGEDPVIESLKTGCDGFVHKHGGAARLEKQLRKLGIFPIEQTQTAEETDA